MNKLKLYFAHNFNNRKEFRELELRLEKELNIELFNPFYDDVTRTEEMNLMDNPEKTTTQKGVHHEWCVVHAKELVQRDLKNLANQDGLFTLILNPSIGTTLEIANAHMMRKPVYVVSKTHYNHPWIKVYATKSFQYLEEFKMFIKTGEVL